MFETFITATLISLMPWVAPLMSVVGGVQAIGAGMVTIGALGGFYTHWKHGHDMNGTVHKFAEVAVLGAACVGVPAILTALGATGALLT